MWYFAWLLGLPFAAAFAVLNAMWYELVEDDKTRKEDGGEVGMVPRPLVLLQ